MDWLIALRAHSRCTLFACFFKLYKSLNRNRLYSRSETIPTTTKEIIIMMKKILFLVLLSFPFSVSARNDRVHSVVLHGPGWYLGAVRGPVLVPMVVPAPVYYSQPMVVYQQVPVTIIREPGMVCRQRIEESPSGLILKPLTEKDCQMRAW